MLEARPNPPALVHEDWGDNVFLESLVDDDLDFEAARQGSRSRSRGSCAPHARPWRRSRAAAWCASGTRGSGSSMMHSATQMPHIIRAGLAECLGIDAGRDPRGRARRRRRLRLQGHPAARGGRARLAARDASARPLRWIEDRREQLIGQRQLPRAPLRPHAYADATAACWRSTARRPSTPAPIRSYPFSACLEAAQVGSILPGPYKMDRTTAAAPSRWPPTSRRSCPIAASRAPACASRSR